MALKSVNTRIDEELKKINQLLKDIDCNGYTGQ